MSEKDLKLNFRYLGGNIACLSVDSINGKSVHNDINNEEAIIIFNSLVGEKENCQTIKTLLEENAELKKQLEEAQNDYCKASKSKYERAVKIFKLENQQKEFIKWLKSMIKMYEKEYKDVDIVEHYNCVLSKYKEIIGDVEDEN